MTPPTDAPTAIPTLTLVVGDAGNVVDGTATAVVGDAVNVVVGAAVVLDVDNVPDV